MARRYITKKNNNGSYVPDINQQFGEIELVKQILPLMGIFFGALLFTGDCSKGNSE